MTSLIKALLKRKLDSRSVKGNAYSKFCDTNRDILYIILCKIYDKKFN